MDGHKNKKPTKKQMIIETEPKKHRIKKEGK